MAERYDEQYRDRGRRDDRGVFGRAGDEVRAWFGDDEAERRRRMDDSEENYRGQQGYPGSQGYGSGDRSQPYGGSSFRRSGAGYGGYSGRGPRGYQRSDTRITEDVCDRLSDAPDVDASDIEVKVSSGEVTLEGTVCDREQKRRAEDVAERISGVREVHNSLRVSRNGDANSRAGRNEIGGSMSITGTNSGSVRSSASGGGADIPHPGITGGGPSGATDVSTTGSGGGGAAGVPANPLGLRDTPESPTSKPSR